MKKFLGLGFRFLVGDTINGIGLGLFGWGYWALGPQLQDGSILLNFLVETRLKSKSFEPLIDFQMFLLQKLL